MKTLLAVTVVLMLSGCNGIERLINGSESSAPQSNRPIYIGVAGQSLSHYSEQLNPTTNNVSKTGKVTMNTNLLTWGSFFTPTSSTPANYGTCMIKLGDQIAAHTNREIRFVFSSVGSTSAQDWGDTLYQRTIDSFKSNSLSPDLILFTQGETDYLTSSDSYKTSILKMLTKWKEAGFTCPVYLSLTSNPSSPTPAVRIAQESLISDGYVLRGPDIDQMRAHGGWMFDGVHPNAAGFIEQANRWYDILRLHIFLIS